MYGGSKPESWRGSLGQSRDLGRGQRVDGMPTYRITEASIIGLVDDQCCAVVIRQGLGQSLRWRCLRQESWRRNWC